MRALCVRSVKSQFRFQLRSPNKWLCIPSILITTIQVIVLPKESHFSPWAAFLEWLCDRHNSVLAGCTWAPHRSCFGGWAEWNGQAEIGKSRQWPSSRMRVGHGGRFQPKSQSAWLRRGRPLGCKGLWTSKDPCPEAAWKAAILSCWSWDRYQREWFSETHDF